MIYFLQQDGGHHAIKIGFTSSDTAETRQKVCQTGNPHPLVVLATMPGERADETILHQRFASAKMNGEWFLPVPELIQFIIKQAPHYSALNILSKIRQKKSRRWPLTIYLAGKIQYNDWRESIVGWQIAKDNFDSLYDFEWNILEKSIFGVHDYCGPFFVPSDNHTREKRADDGHGCEAQQTDKHGLTDTANENISAACLKAIEEADLLFAWIDQLDCYGTITEIGYAKSLGKMIWIAGPKRFRDMWFVYQQAEFCGFSHASPKAALGWWLSHLETRLADSR